MKTTIDLPDGLAAEAKTIAATQRTSLRELVVSGLRAEIERRSAIGGVDFHFPTVAGEGLSIEMDAAGAIARSYGLPTP